MALVSNEYTPEIGWPDRKRQLHRLYAAVRNVRDSEQDYEALLGVWSTIKQDHGDDWLCGLEVLEVLRHHGYAPHVASEIEEWLVHKAENQAELRKLIMDGLKLIDDLMI